MKVKDLKEVLNKYSDDVQIFFNSEGVCWKFNKSNLKLAKDDDLEDSNGNHIKPPILVIRI